MTVNVRTNCRSCGKEVIVENVDKEGFEKWQKGGGHIQNLLPDLSAAERELFISGTCGPCFDKMFKTEG